MSQRALHHHHEVNGQTYGNTGLTKATVLAVRYPDSARTRAPAETTYDLVLHYPRRLLLDVPALRTMASYADGEEVVLRPSYKTVTAAAKSFDVTSGDLQGLDGSIVAVTFLNGNERQPVIMGCFSHPSAQSSSPSYVGSESKGERRVIVHKGTVVEFDKDGNVTLTLAAGKKCRLGSNTSAQSLVLGEVLVDALRELFDVANTPAGVFANVSNVIGTSTDGGLTVKPSPALVALLTTWVVKYLGISPAPAVKTILSGKVKTE